MAEDGTSDEGLMRRFQATFDEAAFDALMVRYHRPATAVAATVLGGYASADDAVQETFLRIVRARHDYDPGRPFAAWFYTILRNVCLDVRRKDVRLARQVEALALITSDAGDSPRSSSSAAGINDWLDTLAPADQEILIYRVVHGMTFQEIAEQVSASVDAVKKRAQRALRRLRETHGRRQSPP